MKIGSCVLAAMKALKEQKIFSGKTTVQKLIYFALPTEMRRLFYRPYHYGPYSESVQGAFTSLLDNNFITRNGSEFVLCNGEDHLKTMQGEEAIVRLNAAAAFLAQHRLASTKDVSILAKVHILSQGKDITPEELPGFIRSRGKYFGWSELEEGKLDDKQLERFICLAREIDGVLDQAVRVH
jgi:uncharacterized protein YwgA